MRVLVTGGTGYLGSALVRALARRGHTPLVFSRQDARTDTRIPLRRGDLRSRTDVDAAVRDVDAVCHAGALVSIWRRRRQDFDDVNVTGTRHVIDACLARRTTRMVYTSSFLALPPSRATAPLRANDYQRTKVEALELVRAAARSGAPIVTLVPGVVYGPGPATEGNLVARLLHDHLHGRLPGIVGADRQWSFAWIDDVADAHAVALERGLPGSEYIVGGENAPQMRLFEIARDVTGRRLPRRLPGSLVRLAAAADELRAQVTGPPPLVTRGVVDIFQEDWALDSAASTADLGYAPRALDPGVRAVLGELSRELGSWPPKSHRE
jgi:NAD+-dependent farnesol dehydrogenase